MRARCTIDITHKKLDRNLVDQGAMVIVQRAILLVSIGSNYIAATTQSSYYFEENVYKHERVR